MKQNQEYIEDNFHGKRVMCGGFALLDHSLLAKVSTKDTPINFSSKDGCLKRSYGGGGGGGGTAVLM